MCRVVLYRMCYEEKLDVQHLGKPVNKFWYVDQIEFYAVFRSDFFPKSPQDTQQTNNCP